MKRISRLLIVAVPCLLAACSGGEVRQTFGLNRDAPDEFTVLSRPPLSVPPDFTLRPPRPGEENDRIPKADAQARSVLLGQEAKPVTTLENMAEPSVNSAVTPVLVNEAPSGAESTFLKRAGSSEASDNIRQQLGEDASKPADTSTAKSLLEKLNGQAKSEPIVDPKKEAERLRTNKDAGKPANAGEVPVENEKPATVLDRIF